MAKVLVTIEDKLLTAIDARATKLGVSRSRYLSDLAEHELGTAKGPGAAASSRLALRAIQELAKEAGVPQGEDYVKIIREMRDSR